METVNACGEMPHHAASLYYNVISVAAAGGEVCHNISSLRSTLA